MNKLIIFDCDGVLVDSELIASRIDAAILTSLGYPISTEEAILQFTGMDERSFAQLIIDRLGIDRFQLLAKLSDQAYAEAVEEELQPLLAPLFTTPFFHIHAKCVASNGIRKDVIRSLHVTNQHHFFPDQTIFTAAEVERGKPAPDLFLFAAAKMGYLPHDCIVIEDSIAGITAARAAGMRVIGFLGGGHTKFDWYKERIRSQDIPFAENIAELLSLLLREYGSMDRAHSSGKEWAEMVES